MKRILFSAVAALALLASTLAWAADEPQGNVAAGVADVGNPLKIGGVASATTPSNVTTGQRVNAWFSTAGAAMIGGVQTSLADAASNTNIHLPDTNGSAGKLATTPSTFNGTTWDRQRGNMDTGALITAAGATTSQTGTDQVNYNGRCVVVVLDMTVVGTGSVTLTIQGKDTASGKYYTLLAGVAVTTNSTNVYEVCPGVTVAANAATSRALPRTWRVITTANNANAATYTVGASVTL
jgi:hypothetical protein